VTTTGESRDPTAGELIDLARHVGFRPDIAALARDQIASARRLLNLTPAEFAELLIPLVGWRSHPKRSNPGRRAPSRPATSWSLPASPPSTPGRRPNLIPPT
jgi:hypothetical protein